MVGEIKEPKIHALFGPLTKQKELKNAVTAQTLLKVKERMTNHPHFIIITHVDDNPTLIQAQRFLALTNEADLSDEEFEAQITSEESIKHGYVETWECMSGDVLLFNEEAKLLDLSLNHAATMVFHENGGSLIDFILGPAILITKTARIPDKNGELSW